MSIGENEVKKIAHLARLSLEEQEVPHTAKSLSQIFNLIEQLNQAETLNVEPMAHPNNIFQRLREDEVTEKNEREAIQKIAPLVEAGLYLVPPVIE